MIMPGVYRRMKRHGKHASFNPPVAEASLVDSDRPEFVFLIGV
jgi:hypothetical protein